MAHPPVVRVEALSKRYRIGVNDALPSSPMQALGEVIRRPWQNLRNLRRLAHFEEGHDDNDASIIWALRDVSFEVNQGDVLGIIGRNGAGKSTLLKVLSRITAPTSGYVATRGRVASLLEVGTGFNPELTGRENVYLNGTILGMRRREIDRNFDEIVAFSGVEKFVDTPVKRYSSGMKMRLAFAVAAHLEPEILIVDEVLAVGDVEFQRRCLGKMNEVSRSGRTILFVSHNMLAIQQLCTRAILLNDGKIEIDGTTDDVIRHYLPAHDSAKSSVVWTSGSAPGDSSWELVAMRVRNAAGVEVTACPISEEMFIEIVFRVKEHGTRATIAILLFDEHEYCAFSSLSNRDPHFYGKPLAVGCYVTTCRIPGHILNNGTYTISLNGYSDKWISSFRVEHAISFQALDDGVSRGDFVGLLRGATRPLLEWQTREYTEP